MEGKTEAHNVTNVPEAVPQIQTHSPQRIPTFFCVVELYPPLREQLKYPAASPYTPGTVAPSLTASFPGESSLEAASLLLLIELL